MSRHTANKSAVTVLFPDTNVLLHYKPLTDIDWREIGNAKQVVLVLCSVVVAELEGKKYDSRLAKRAERAIRGIHRIRQAGGTVREGVSLEVLADQVRREDIPGHLDPDNKDTRIVFSVRRYLEDHPEHQAAVVSGDFNMENLCAVNGVSCIELADEHRLPLPQDETAKKLLATQQELARVRDGLPDCHISIMPNEDEDFEKAYEVVLDAQIGQVDVDAKVEEQKALRPALVAADYDFGVGAAGGLRRIGPKSVASYNAELDRYYAELYRYWERVNECQQENRRTLRFVLAAENRGGCPAESLDVSLAFPARFSVVSLADNPEARSLWRPQEPKPPEMPKPLIQEMLRQFRPASVIDPFPTALLPSSLDLWAPKAEIEGSVEEGFLVRAHVKQLSHHDRVYWGEFVAIFRSWGEVGPFHVKYAIRADNHPDKKTGEIPIVVRMRDDSDGGLGARQT